MLIRILPILLCLPFLGFSQRIGLLTKNSSYTPPVAEDFYVSAAGVGTDCSFASPCSMATLLTKTISNGDRILLNRGDSFELNDYALANLNTITITAYGSGALPIVRSSVSISGQTWTNNGDGTYYTPLATEPGWVWRGGNAARLAESAWYQIDAVPSTTVRSIAAATLGALSSTVGAKVIFKQFDFRATQIHSITGEDDATGNLTFTPSLATAYAAVGMALKIMNQAQFMTTEGDWYYDAVAQRLYVKSTATPAGTDIRISTGTNTITALNITGLTITNIDFRNVVRTAVDLRSCINTGVTNCTFQDYRGTGVRIYGVSSNFTCTDNMFLDGGMRGVEYAGVVNGAISRNTFTNIGIQDNIGHPWDDNLTNGTALTMMGNISAPSTSSNFTISENTMTNLGYQGIHWWGPTFSFTKNRIDNFGLRWNDGGAIHTYYISALGSSTSSGLIENNIISNGVGAVDGTNHSIFFEGIYIDAGCNDITINNNSIYTISHSGIFTNWNSTDITVTNNHVMGCPFQVNFREDTTPATSPNWPNSIIDFTGNILASMSSAQRAVLVETFNGVDTYNPFTTPGNSDHNAYVNPYTQTLNNYKRGSVTSYTLATWRTKMGKDASSTTRNSYMSFTNSSNAAQETKIEINATDAAVNFNVPTGYSDHNGNAFSNPVSIPAYSSLLYFKNTAFP